MNQVFTWYGATIEMDGTTETDYTADEVLFPLSSIYHVCAYTLAPALLLYMTVFSCVH